jgi:hypothetical protein
MIKIYKLIYNNEIVYVGQTKQKYLSSRKAAGYGDTVPFFKECSIELIEETLDKSRERYWIERLINEGHTLLNKRDGDTGLDRIKYQGEYQKEYYEKNKEKKREYQKEYKKVFRENNKEYMKEYCQNNKEKKREYDREYYEKKKLLKDTSR